MRLLVTGAGGQLGRELLHRGNAAGMTVVALARAECDIVDHKAVARALDEHEPEVVVNCAAWTNVDGAEQRREAAFAVNADGPRVLAEACTRRDILLTHLSTDYVFDGEMRNPIPESAPPAPRSVYGASKLAGELAVRELSERHQIVRTSGLYGRDGANFVVKVLAKAAAGEELRVVIDQVTSPTWTGDLAPAILRLVELGLVGTFHVTNSGSTSWWEFARTALALAGYEPAVTPITTDELGAAAPRPRFSVLDNGAWRALGEPPLRHWNEALDQYVSELRVRGLIPCTSPAASRGAAETP